MSKASISRMRSLRRVPAPPASCRVPSHLPFTTSPSPARRPLCGPLFTSHSTLGTNHSPLTPNHSPLTTVFSTSCHDFSSNFFIINTCVFRLSAIPNFAPLFSYTYGHTSHNLFGMNTCGTPPGGAGTYLSNRCASGPEAIVAWSPVAPSPHHEERRRASQVHSWRLHFPPAGSLAGHSSLAPASGLW